MGHNEGWGRNVLDAVSVLEQALTEAYPDRGEVEVVLWAPGPWGVRVAEVSWEKVDPANKYWGGISFMRSDAGSAQAILSVEQAIVHLVWPEVDPDEAHHVIAAAVAALA